MLRYTVTCLSIALIAGCASSDPDQYSEPKQQISVETKQSSAEERTARNEQRRVDAILRGEAAALVVSRVLDCDGSMYDGILAVKLGLDRSSPQLVILFEVWGAVGAMRVDSDDLSIPPRLRVSQNSEELYSISCFRNRLPDTCRFKVSIALKDGRTNAFNFALDNNQVLQVIN